jgi:hypothetical protein
MYWCLRKLQRNFRKLDAGLRLGLGGVTCHLKYTVYLRYWYFLALRFSHIPSM